MHRIEKGEVWCKPGLLGWIKIVDIHIEDYDSFGDTLKGVSVDFTDKNGNWRDLSHFIECNIYEDFLRHMENFQVVSEEAYDEKLYKEKWFQESDDSPIHMWFELTYAQYLTIPRSVLQSMSSSWQGEFVRLLEELDETIDWLPKEGRYWVTLKGDKGKEFYDEYGNYDRGRRQVPLRSETSDLVSFDDKAQKKMDKGDTACVAKNRGHREEQ